MAKACPKCAKQCSETAKFCTQCRHVFDSAPNPTCQRGHPLLPGATVCPICQAQDGRTDTVVEGVQPGPATAYSRGGTQVENIPGGRPAEARMQPPAGRGGTMMVPGGSPPPLGGSPPPAVGPRAEAQKGGRSGTMVVAPPGQPAGPPQTERKIVAVLVTFDTTPSGQTFPIRVGRNRIGRNPENEISVPNDMAMSGTNTYVHFYEGSGSFVISDEHSQNGTFVNGNNIEADSVKLSNYATIRSGITQFTLMMVNPHGHAHQPVD
jgi:hypothetical protein